MGLAERLQRAWRNDDALAQALRPLGVLHAALLWLRVLLYRVGLKRSERLPVPVVVVGNWIVGGAGKTPTTLAVLRICARQGLRAGVISRGYGRAHEDQIRLLEVDSSAIDAGDEPLLIHRRAGVPVAVGRDRVAAARALLSRHPGLDLLISDDGLQHWRLPRQLSILVFDERGLGNGRLLPAGPMRQLRQLPAPPGSSENFMVLYNTARPSTPLRGALAHRRLAGALPLEAWWRGEAADADAWPHLQASTGLYAAAGLAEPERFFTMLEAQGLNFRRLPLPDHERFTQIPWPADATVLVTEKDAIKLRPDRAGIGQVWVVALDFCPEQAFEEALQQQLQQLCEHHG